MSQSKSATMVEQLVSESDHMALSRLVTEHGDATTLPYSVGEDHDRFVRTDEGWKFVSRRWVEMYRRGDDLDLP